MDTSNQSDAYREIVLLNLKLRNALMEVAEYSKELTSAEIYTIATVAVSQVSPGGAPCKRGHTAGANDPQECAWPHCGCDPVADSVLSALQEEGLIIEDGTMKKTLDDVIKIVQSYVASKETTPRR